MSEPNATAEHAEEIAPGIWYWAVDDDRIGGFVSSAHALATDDGAVLIDPLPLQPGALGELGAPAAICLTSGSHERSAWRLRREHNLRVYAPEGVAQVEEEPDVRYREGDVLPGGLEPFFAPGPGTTQHALLHSGSPAVLFTSDLFVNPAGGAFAFVPDEHLHDPAEGRRSALRLLDLDFDVLCLGHGRPLADDPKAAISALLERAR